MSGSFWQYIITTVAGIAIGVLSAWATLRASNPKLKLNWWVQSNASLLPQAVDNGVLTVQLGSTRLSKPRLVELVVANTGRRDITAAMFHGGNKIKFGFEDFKVVSILGVTSKPAGTMYPALTFDSAGPMGEDGRLEIHPSLLRRGQEIVVTVLGDGDETPVQLLASPLVDVPVVSEPPGARSRALAGAVQGTTIALGPLRMRL